MRHAEDGVHRRADFMTHVGEESALGHVGGFGLERPQIELVVQLLKLDLRGLQFRDVRKQPENAQHLIARDVRNVFGAQVGGISVGLGSRPQKADRLSTQGRLHKGQALMKQFLAQQIPQMDALHLLSPSAEPFPIGLVGEFEAQIAIDVGHLAWDRVDQPLHEVLVGLGGILGQFQIPGALFDPLFKVPVEFAQFILGAPAFGNVGQHAMGADRISGCIATDAAVDAHRADSPVRTPKLKNRPFDTALLLEFRKIHGQGRQGLFGQKIRDRAAGDVVASQPSHQFKPGVVDFQDVSSHVQRLVGQRRLFEQPAKTLLRFRKRPLGGLRRRDVANHGHKLWRVARHEHGHSDVDLDRRAVATLTGPVKATRVPAHQGIEDLGEGSVAAASIGLMLC